MTQRIIRFSFALLLALVISLNSFVSPMLAATSTTEELHSMASYQEISASVSDAVSSDQAMNGAISNTNSVDLFLPIIKGYTDNQQEIDNSVDEFLDTSIGAGVAIGTSVASASLAGAGSLTGYAGMASAVSTLGLGGVTTAIAGAMGSSATGAAATAVVTAAVGGPLVMGAIIVGGTGATAYGLYQLGGWIGEQMK
jgi:hypothetical protein